jgi:hypothetical protein
VGWMLELISAHLVRVELRPWEHALQSKDAETHRSATPFYGAKSRFIAKNYADSYLRERDGEHPCSKSLYARGTT